MGYVETNNKDFKKGSKDATKALKKLEEFSKETIQALMAKAESRTTNSAYLSGYNDVCRQMLMQVA